MKGNGTSPPIIYFHNTTDNDMLIKNVWLKCSNLCLVNKSMVQKFFFTKTINSLDTDKSCCHVTSDQGFESWKWGDPPTSSNCLVMLYLLSQPNHCLNSIIVFLIYASAFFHFGAIDAKSSSLYIFPLFAHFRHTEPSPLTK